jgi:hypothetical protein
VTTDAALAIDQPGLDDDVVPAVAGTEGDFLAQRLTQHVGVVLDVGQLVVALALGSIDEVAKMNIAMLRSCWGRVASWPPCPVSQVTTKPGFSHHRSDRASVS